MQWFINALCIFIATSGPTLAGDVDLFSKSHENISDYDVETNSPPHKTSKKPGVSSPRNPKSRRLEKKPSTVGFNLSKVDHPRTSSPKITKKCHDHYKSPSVISSKKSETKDASRSTLDEKSTKTQSKNPAKKSRSLVLKATPIKKIPNDNFNAIITDSANSLSQKDRSDSNESPMDISAAQKEISSSNEPNATNNVPPLVIAPSSFVASPPPIFRKNNEIQFDSASDFWSPDYRSVRTLITGLDLRQKNDQIVQLLFDAIEAGSVIEIEAAYQALLDNGYDVNQIGTKHKLNPPDAAKKYRHHDLSLYLSELHNAFLKKSFKRLSNAEKAQKLLSLIQNNATQRTNIIKSSFNNNFDLVNSVFENGTLEQITDMTFSYKIFEELIATKIDNKILKIQMKLKAKEHGQQDILDESHIANQQVANINKFKGTYLLNFYHQAFGILSKENEIARLKRVEKWVSEEKISEARKFLSNQKLLMANKIINDVNANNDEKLEAAAALLIAEALFSEEVIEELSSQTEAWHNMMVKKAQAALNHIKHDLATKLKNAKEIIDATHIDPVGQIMELVQNEALKEQADQMLENLDFDVPEIIGTSNYIKNAKQYLQLQQISNAAKSISEAEKYFSTWYHLWLRFDKRMSQTFNWNCSRNNFRTNIKSIFDRLWQNESQSERSRVTFADKSIDKRGLWFLMHKPRLLSFVVKETEEELLTMENSESKMHQAMQQSKFNEVINNDKDFILKLKTVELHDLAEQKELLIFALDHWECFDKRKLINQLFFPTSHAMIGNGIFLNRPLFNGDEEFADLF